ncbi:MAG: phosphoglucosamine mutase [Elusimicrobiota bacterium]
MPKYFGTDGIRGIPWKFPFTEDFLKKLGYASSSVLGLNKSKKVFVGSDSRKSSDTIKKYLFSGLRASGAFPIDLGTVNTPLVAYSCIKEKAAFGIMVSASHNPPEFNGVKFFNSLGEKISEKQEEEIEKEIDFNLKNKSFPKASADKTDFSDKYCDFIVSTFPDPSVFKGLKIVLDCSNGGAYKIAPKVFSRLGIETKLIGVNPNGNNINKGCGALDTLKMRSAVSKGKFFGGVSLDGDADRCILADEKGELMDGDDIVACLSSFIYGKKKKSAVLTVMSNYGLFKYLKTKRIKTYEVSVGDRNVTEAMKKYKVSVGGENSGHIILLDFLPTGDGILSSLWTIYAAASSGLTLSQTKNNWKRYPQKLLALKVEEKKQLEKIPGFINAVKEKEKKIKGRIFVRYSGTEPLLRILAEGEDKNLVEKAALEIAEIYKSASALRR